MEHSRAPRCLFSVVLPTHNRPELLSQAIDSVLAQTIQDFELVVVDDASDPPAEVCSDERVQLIRFDRNRGPSAARNAALARASGRYVCFLDDDDLYTPDRLELALEGLRDTPVAICFARFIAKRRGHNRVLNGDISDIILEGSTPSLGRTALRTELVPQFDERWSAVEDIDWWVRVAREHPVRTVPRVGYLVRRHDGPRGLNSLPTRIAENLEFLEEHRSFFDSHPGSLAYRWTRIGLMAEADGDRRMARRAFQESFRLRPGIKSLWHFARSSIPAPLGRQAMRMRSWLDR